jgi:hypothetical protein
LASDQFKDGHTDQCRLVGPVFAFVLGIPSLWSSVAFGAITSIATIGLYIFLHRIRPQNFERGAAPRL